MNHYKALLQHLGLPDESDDEAITEILKRASRGLTTEAICACLALRREIALDAALLRLLEEGRIDADFNRTPDADGDANIYDTDRYTFSVRTDGPQDHP